MRRFAVLRRVGGHIGVYTRGVYRGFLTLDVFLWSGAIAFKVLITLFPLVILAVGVFGLVLRQGAIRETIGDFIIAFAPSFQIEQVGDLLVGFADQGDTVTLIGSLGLFATVVTLFTTLRVILGNIFKGTHERRSLLRGYALDIGLATLGGILFLLTFGLTLTLDIVDATGFEVLNALGLHHGFWLSIWSATNQFVELLVPPLISTALFFQLYFLNPLPHPHRTSALVGALTTAVLWEVAKRLFSFYAVEFGTFERYSGMGTLGLAVALVFWTYYSGLVFIVGAMVTAIHDERAFDAQWSVSRPRSTGVASDADLPTEPQEAYADSVRVESTD